jgi:acyl-CoA reductase-like NAD-dependent aldehyde dehydrogenase
VVEGTEGDVEKAAKLAKAGADVWSALTDSARARHLYR